VRLADRWGGAGRHFTLTPVDKPILPDKVGWLHNEMLKTPVAHGYYTRHERVAHILNAASAWQLSKRWVNGQVRLAVVLRCVFY
jgi:hypothetical protein